MQILRPIKLADKPLPPSPPGQWGPWAVALIYALFRASEARVRRYEQLNAELAREVDRLRRSQRRIAA